MMKIMKENTEGRIYSGLTGFYGCIDPVPIVIGSIRTAVQHILCCKASNQFLRFLLRGKRSVEPAPVQYLHP